MNHPPEKSMTDPAEYSKDLDKIFLLKDLGIAGSPLKILMLTITSIFLCEVIVMTFFSILPTIPTWMIVFLDSILLVIMLSPILYYYLFRPLLLHIYERKKAVIALKKSYEELELRVNDRTAELANANEQLRKEIEKRKRIDDSLNENEERLIIALEATRAGIWDWDIKSKKAVFISPHFKEMMELDEKDSENISFDEWSSKIHPDDKERVLDSIKKHLNGKAPYSITYRYSMKNGEYHKHSAHGLALFDEKGKAYRLVGAFRDITVEEGC